MIRIVMLLFLFLLYVSAHREGMRNFQPITEGDKVYGVNILKNNPEHIFKKLSVIDPANKDKYSGYIESDVLVDMQYFNNASYLIFQLNT